jgi:hypothetical protein
MATTSSRALPYWRLAFLIVETSVLFIFLSSWTAEAFFGRYWVPDSQAMEMAIAGTMATAWPFSLVVSLFFFRSLRSLAVTGWFIAIGILLIGLFTPAR